VCVCVSFLLLFLMLIEVYMCVLYWFCIVSGNWRVLRSLFDSLPIFYFLCTLTHTCHKNRGNVLWHFLLCVCVCALSHCHSLTEISIAENLCVSIFVCFGNLYIYQKSCFD